MGETLLEDGSFTGERMWAEGNLIKTLIECWAVRSKIKS